MLIINQQETEIGIYNIDKLGDIMSEKEYLEFLNSLDEDLIIDENYFYNKINIKMFHGNVRRIWKF